MTCHSCKDPPDRFALADVTVCVNYHCSLIGPTDPNEYHMWTGQVGNDSKADGPVITNAEPDPTGRAWVGPLTPRSAGPHGQAAEPGLSWASHRPDI